MWPSAEAKSVFVLRAHLDPLIGAAGSVFVDALAPHSLGADQDVFAPVRVCEVELSEPLPAISADGYSAAWVLVRWYSEPLAQVDVSLADGDISPGRLAALLWPAAAPLLTPPASNSPTSAPPIQRIPAAPPTREIRLYAS